MADPTTLRIGHVSDTHLGFEAYQARTDSGHNQRGADIVQAFRRASDGIREWDPPLVVHSGDLFEAPLVPVRYLLAARTELRRLAEVRPDGTRRAVVVVAGNHDTPRNRRDGCQLDLFRGLPGIEVVSFGYSRLRFDPADGYDPALGDVVVHALPHDSLKDPEVLAEVAPVEGCTNILVTHGVAEGDDTFRRMIGREFPVPEDLLAAGWDYVALGHWHTQGPVTVAGDGSFAYYAGSTECIDFSDLRGRGSSTERAWLAVTFDGARPTVQRRSFPTRHLLSLDEIDATGMEPSQVADALVAQLEGTNPDGAIVRQRVRGLTRDLWALVDLSKLRERAAVCLHHRVEPSYRRVESDSGTVRDDGAPDLGDLEALLVERAGELVPDADRDAVLASARRLLGSALGEPVGDDKEPKDPGKVTDAEVGAAPSVEDPASGPPNTGAGTDPDESGPAPGDPVETDTDANPDTGTEPGTDAAPDHEGATGDDVEQVEVRVPPAPEDPAAAFREVLGEFDGLDTLDAPAP